MLAFFSARTWETFLLKTTQAILNRSIVRYIVHRQESALRWAQNGKGSALSAVKVLLCYCLGGMLSSRPDRIPYLVIRQPWRKWRNLEYYKENINHPKSNALVDHFWVDAHMWLMRQWFLVHTFVADNFLTSESPPYLTCRHPSTLFVVNIQLVCN